METEQGHIDHLGEIIFKTMGRMYMESRWLDHPHDGWVFYMPSHLTTLLVAYLTRKAMADPLDGEQNKIFNIPIVEGYENAIILCHPKSVAYRGWPILRCDKLATRGMQITVKGKDELHSKVIQQVNF
jgi:hypothetical protein